MMVADHELDAFLKRLHLANTRRAWRELARRAEQEDWTYHDFLTLLVTEEIAHRQQTRLERVVRRARFPFLKTIDDFNFIYQSTVRLSLLGSALSADFTTEGHCVIFNGKPGRGKTHLAIAIAYRAIQHGFDALFVTAAELIDDLSAAFRAGRFAAALAIYTHPSILVVDEVGYLTCGTDAANVLFHVVNDRHRKKRAMIFTTNKPLNQWGRVLHDEDLAHAIVDRVLERGRFLTLDGPSMRTKHLGLDDPTAPEASDQPARLPDRQVIRISGIDAPEFPEPTTGNQTSGGTRPTTRASVTRRDRAASRRADPQRSSERRPAGPRVPRQHRVGPKIRSR
jgi:DNA replication protein DnaC